MKTMHRSRYCFAGPYRVGRTNPLLPVWMVLAGCCALSLSFAQTPLGNLDIIAPQQTIAPDTWADLGLIWDGGEPPWTWTIEFSQLDDPDRIYQITGAGANVCDDPTNRRDCRSQVFPTLFRWPEIATLRAAVEDSLGNLVTRTARIRVASEGPFWHDGRRYVNVVPDQDQPPFFQCRGVAGDPPLVTLSLEPVSLDPGFPFIGVFEDPRIGSPYRLSLKDSGFFTEPFVPETLYELSRVEWIGQDGDDFADVLSFPLQYGDYSQPDTTPIDGALNPSPPLRTHRLYEIDLRGYRHCLQFSAVGDARFMLNPPAPGDPVIIQGPADEVDPDNVEPDAIDPKLLELLAINNLRRIQSEEAAMAACMKEAVGLQVISIISAGGILGTSFGVKNLIDDLVFTIVTNAATMDALREFCIDTLLSAPATRPDRAALNAQSASTPQFDLEIFSGSGRLTFPDPTLAAEIRTAHATVIVSGATVEIAQRADGQASAIGSPDAEIVVTPNNPALPPATVPAGFFVTLAGSTISPPNEFPLFANGFE